VRLDIKSPGRATFTVQAGESLKGLVTLDIGYNERTLQRHFLGYVERSTAANSTQQVVTCRELSSILANPLPLNLRHVDLQAVLAEISDKTGLGFRVGAASCRPRRRAVGRPRCAATPGRPSAPEAGSDRAARSA